MADTLTHEGQTFVRSTEGFRGKKAEQVAKILKILMGNPGIPYEFDDLCQMAGAKYPTDVVAAAMALHMTELVDTYKATTGARKTYIVWTEDER